MPTGNTSSTGLSLPVPLWKLVASCPARLRVHVQTYTVQGGCQDPVLQGERSVSRKDALHSLGFSISTAFQLDV